MDRGKMDRDGAGEKGRLAAGRNIRKSSFPHVTMSTE